MNTMEKEKFYLGADRTEGVRTADSFIGEHIAMFMPVSGPCEFAVSSMHAHPSYQFVLAFNDRVAFRIHDKEVLTDPGKLLAISPGVVHMEILADCFPRYIAMFIEKEYFEGIAAAGANVSYILTGKTEEERQAALEDRMDAIKECTQRALLLTSDQQKGELVRDVLLGDRWNKPEIIDAAIERYVAVRQVRHKGTKD